MTESSVTGGFAAEAADLARGQAAARRVAFTTRLAASLCGTGALLGIWAWASAGLPDPVLPSPARTGTALVDLARSGELVTQLTRTLGRTLVGSILAVTLGIACGVLCGLSSVADEVVRPVRILLTGLPPVVTVVIAMIWLGPSGPVVVLAVATAMVPQIMLATREATRVVDRDLLEMSRLFRVPLRWRLRHIVVPATAPPVLAAVAVALSNALRLAMMAELLAAPDGSGAGIATARTYLETPTVFAWAVVAVVFALAVDALVLGPVRKKAVAWSL